MAEAAILITRKYSSFNPLTWNFPCTQIAYQDWSATMVLKMERIANGETTILFLSGRIQSQHVAELKDQIEASSPNIVVDLEDVKLVDRDVVCFLGNCEAKGVVLRQCPIYVREWIDREKTLER